MEDVCISYCTVYKEFLVLLLLCVAIAFCRPRRRPRRAEWSCPFTYKSMPLAVFDIRLLLATGAFYMFCALWHMWGVYYFSAAPLFAPYMAWLCFALYLTWRAEQ